MDSQDQVCVNCSKNFTKKGKNYNRTALFSKIRNRKCDFTPADILKDNFLVSVTPNRKGFICSDCEKLLFSVSKNENRAAEKFQNVRKRGSYVSSKLKSPTKSPFSSPLSKKRKNNEIRTGFTDCARTPTLDSPGVSSLPNSKTGKGIRLLLNRNYKSGMKQLVHSSKSIKAAFISVAADIVRDESCSLSKGNLFDPFESIQDFSLFSLENILKNMKAKCPLLYETVVASLTLKKSHNAVIKKTKRKEVSLKPVVTSIISQIAFSRNKKCSTFQSANATLLWLSGCKRKLFAHFNKLGLCLSRKASMKCIDRLRSDYDGLVHSWKEKATQFYANDLENEWEDVNIEDQQESDLDISGVESLDSYVTNTDDQSEKSSVSEAFDSVDTSTDDSLSEGDLVHSFDTISSEESHLVNESGRELFDITFDNINQRTHARHYKRGKHGQMLNMVQGYATKERIPTGHLSADLPTADTIRSLPLANFLPSEADTFLLKTELQTIVKRILVDGIQEFNEVDVSWHIEHQFSTESRQKSVIVPLGVMSKDETLTADMIDIMDVYHKYIPTSKDGDPVTIPLFCDGLSCERGECAKKARTNGEDGWARLCGLEPSIQEWHLRLLQLQDTYTELFRMSTQRTIGTLYHIKQAYGFKMVSGEVSNCFNYALDMLHFATNAYVEAFCMDYLEKRSIDIANQSLEEKSHIIDELAENLVNFIFCEINTKQIINVQTQGRKKTYEYCTCHMDLEDSIMVFCENPKCKIKWFHIECIGMSEEQIPNDSYYCSKDCKEQHTRIIETSGDETVADQLIDRQCEYTRRLMWRGLNDMIRNDAIKENDGPRIIRHWKFDLCDLQEHSHPKYVIFAMKLLVNIFGGGSERLSNQLIWNRTISVHGGIGRNIPKDLHMEHLNKKYKESCKASIGQLTEATIQRHSQLVALEEHFVTFYELNILLSPFKPVRKRGAMDQNADSKHLRDKLRESKVFNSIPRRKVPGFNSLKHTVHIKKVLAFKEKLLKVLNDIADRREDV